MAGLFTVTPQSVQMAQAEQAAQQGLQRANLAPGRGMVAAAGQGGAFLGEGISKAFGGQSPLEKVAGIRQKVQQEMMNSGLNPVDNEEEYTRRAGSLLHAYGDMEGAMEMAGRLREYKKLENASGTAFTKDVKFLMGSENLSKKDAIKRHIEIKRAGVEETGAKAEVEGRVNVWEKKYEKAGENVLDASDKFDSSSRISDLVFSEINNRGGIQPFLNEYSLQISPAGNLVQSVTALAKGVGIDLDPSQKAIFVQQLQQLNTKEALDLMSKLGGSDSNEELRRVMAAIPNINDAGPAAMVAKTLLLQMTTGLDREKAVLRESMLDTLGPNFRESDFQKQWRDVSRTYLDGWVEENRPLLSELGQADYTSQAKDKTIKDLKREDSIEDLLKLYPGN